jgi:hypothetical protein
MICPIKTDPAWIKLKNAQPDLAHYLWNKYEGNVPAEYYTSTAPIKPGVEGFKQFVQDDKSNLDTTIEDCGLPS